MLNIKKKTNWFLFPLGTYNVHFWLRYLYLDIDQTSNKIKSRLISTGKYQRRKSRKNRISVEFDTYGIHSLSQVVQMKASRINETRGNTITNIQNPIMYSQILFVLTRLCVMKPEWHRASHHFSRLCVIRGINIGLDNHVRLEY